MSDARAHAHVLPESSAESGVLYVVATPIGNLADLTERAKDLLSSVDLVAAEDTRHTRKLLVSLGANPSMLSLHDHNEQGRIAQIQTRLQAGDAVALVSDAGTPLISDPGFTLVRALREAGHRVVPVPGACALITALSASGLPTDRFTFNGFLPAKSKGRRDRLQQVVQESATQIFYESPHRIMDTLDDMIAVFGEHRDVCLARELTKTFETFLTMPLGQLRDTLVADTNQQRGEMVLMVAGRREADLDQAWPQAQAWLESLMPLLPLTQACAVVARHTGIKKKVLYNWALSQSSDEDA